MKKLTFLCMTCLGLMGILSLLGVAGCKFFGNNDTDYGPEPVKTNAMGVVIIGMEQSNYAGNCPGARVDASRMEEIFRKYTDNVTVLLDSKATKSAVVTAFEDVVAKYDFSVIYYSGHGGSGKFGATSEEEEDGKDEFLCLYDNHLLDNDIWNIISKSKNKVFLMFDCCHSKTMYKTAGVTMKNAIRKLKASSKRSNFAMMCWSGCPDDTYSYGSRAGGAFTITFCEHMRYDDSYGSLWNKIMSDEWLLGQEIPQQTIIGNWDTSETIFKW